MHIHSIFKFLARLAQYSAIMEICGRKMPTAFISGCLGDVEKNVTDSSARKFKSKLELIVLANGGGQLGLDCVVKNWTGPLNVPMKMTCPSLIGS